MRSKKGLLVPRIGAKGGVHFNCGHIERFGTEDEPKLYCKAELIDPDTIELKLPPWADEQDV